MAIEIYLFSLNLRKLFSKWAVVENIYAGISEELKTREMEEEFLVSSS